MPADVGLFVAFNHAINDPVAVGGHLGGDYNHVCKIPKICILSRKFYLKTAVRGTAKYSKYTRFFQSRVAAEVTRLCSISDFSFSAFQFSVFQYFSI
jgi:hypothetical protein